jgi:hypothetical protein
MEYQKAIQLAQKGKLLLLPQWTGNFYWNYHTNKLEFRNGNYHLDNLEQYNLDKRTDWYYII